jgi:hypothetical protein
MQLLTVGPYVMDLTVKYFSVISHTHITVHISQTYKSSFLQVCLDEI